MLSLHEAICLVTIALPLCAGAARLQAQTAEPQYIDPPSLTHPTGYTQVVVAPDGRTVYVAGQNATDSAGQVVGGTDFQAQAAAAYTNLQRALASVGGSLKDIVKTTTFLTDARQIPLLRPVRTRFLDATHPPANTLVIISSLARPNLLIEVEAVAILPTPYRSAAQR